MWLLKSLKSVYFAQLIFHCRNGYSWYCHEKIIILTICNLTKRILSVKAIKNIYHIIFMPNKMGVWRELFNWFKKYIEF